MPQFRIVTPVAKNFLEVKQGFTQELFLTLNPPPPFPKVDLLRFDGCVTGDVVQLKLHFPFFSQVWESKIVSHTLTNDLWQFIDVGSKLPFFLKSWQHIHSVESCGKGSKIIDDITFETPWWIPAFLMALLLKYQFGLRTSVYQHFFGKL